MKNRFAFMLLVLLTISYTLEAKKTMDNTDKVFPKYDTTFGFSAESIKDYKTDLEIPTFKGVKKVRKLNCMGFMRLETDVISDKFIEFASTNKGESLDIGCAYGFIPLKVLHAGGKIIANDTYSDHLLILNKSITPEIRKNLIFNTDKFPASTNFPEGSLQAVSLNRIIHFLSPAEVKLAFSKLNKWMGKGGRVFITAMTPYHPAIADFGQEYDKRVAQGVEWPGVITDMKKRQPNIKEDIPDYIHTFSKEVLTKQLEENGFKIVEADYFDFASSAATSRGNKAYVGVIAEKI